MYEISQDNLRVIWNYENQAELPSQCRYVSYSDGSFRLNPNCDLSGGEVSAIASDYHDFLRYCFAVENVVNEDEPLFRAGYGGEVVVVRNSTPRAFLDIGLQDFPVSITEEHLWTCMAPLPANGGKNRHWHGLDETLMKRLPWLLERPALISNHPSSDEKLLVVLPDTDSRGFPLVLPLKPNSATMTLDLDVIETNLILTVFGPENYANYFGAAVTDDLVIYIDSAQEEVLAEKCGFQPFRGLNTIQRDKIVRMPFFVQKNHLIR